MKIKPAKHFIRLFLRLTGFRGVTLPWAIYILPDSLDDERLRRHEAAHWKQKQAYGNFGFYWLYFKFWLRYGYRNHPFEIEARKAETE
jgi:hypothetical protein